MSPWAPCDESPLAGVEAKTGKAKKKDHLGVADPKWCRKYTLLETHPEMTNKNKRTGTKYSEVSEIGRAHV